MKERIKGAFTKKKIFHFLKMALFVVALSLILLSLLGTVAHATGLVDDTINAENLYSKYPLSNTVQPVPRKPRPAIIHVEIKLIIRQRIFRIKVLGIDSVVHKPRCVYHRSQE